MLGDSPSRDVIHHLKASPLGKRVSWKLPLRGPGDEVLHQGEHAAMSVRLDNRNDVSGTN